MKWTSSLRHWQSFAIVAVILTVSIAWFENRSIEGFTGLLLSAVLPQDTEYASGYTDRGFRAVRIGMPDTDAARLLGPPFGIVWLFQVAGDIGCPSIYFENDIVVTWSSDICRHIGIRKGMTVADVSMMIKKPDRVSWIYSRSRHNTNYRERVVVFEDNRVARKYSGWWID